MTGFWHETMPGVDVKRFAALDMHGARGTTRRRRVILAEFIIGAAAMVALGVWFVIGVPGLGYHILGIWVIGAGLNYVPLAAYAVSLSRAGALEAELAGVDTSQELRRYSVRQVWLLVPLSLVAMAARGRKPA
jgi:hypothetical protein